MSPSFSGPTAFALVRTLVTGLAFAGCSHHSQPPQFAPQTPSSPSAIAAPRAREIWPLRASLDELQLDASIDYIELRVEHTVQDSGGFRCARAADLERCEQAYGVLQPPAHTPLASSFAPPIAPPMRIYLVAERSGTLDIISSRDELRILLGRIDSLAKAAVVARMYGIRASHGQRSDDGWRLGNHGASMSYQVLHDGTVQPITDAANE